MEAPITETTGTAWDAKPNTRRPYVRGRGLAGGGTFNVLSLGNWVTIAAMADVPSVPLVHLGAMDGGELMRLYDMMEGGEADPDAPPLAVVGINQRLAALEGEWMVRCDGVSGDAVKVAMARKPYEGEDRETFRKGTDSSGRGYHLDAETGRKYFITDDVRLDECISSWTEEDCPIWARPVVRARQIETPEAPFQAEWRVFVDDGRIAAVSTYYPQAPRARSAEDHAALAKVLGHVSAMIDTMRSTGLVPHHPRFEGREGFDLAAIHCSLDFIESEDGAVLLLEGGPPHLSNPSWGGHACAFSADGSSEDNPQPAGIAWGGGVFDGPEVLARLVEENRPAGIDGPNPR